MAERPDEIFEREATADERKTCPTCGIASYWLKRASDSFLAGDTCSDAFHVESRAVRGVGQSPTKEETPKSVDQGGNRP